eukprot:COSAG06_NODE_6614_length_2855_cov_3.132438_1_plen_226_part_00
MAADHCSGRRLFTATCSIELCKAAVYQARESLSVNWRRSLLLLNFCRRAVFLPILVTCIVILVTRRGGDALSVCLNTVAVLFITDLSSMAQHAQILCHCHVPRRVIDSSCDSNALFPFWGAANAHATHPRVYISCTQVDNLTYELALSEAVRARMEEAGHVELSEAEWAVMKRTKYRHMYLIVGFVLCSTVLAGQVGQTGAALTLLTFAVGGVLEWRDKRKLPPR